MLWSFMCIHGISIFISKTVRSSWEEMYGNVQNVYTHCLRSLKGAMSIDFQSPLYTIGKKHYRFDKPCRRNQAVWTKSPRQAKPKISLNISQCLSAWSYSVFAWGCPCDHQVPNSLRHLRWWTFLPVFLCTIKGSGEKFNVKFPGSHLLDGRNTWGAWQA